MWLSAAKLGILMTLSGGSSQQLSLGENSTWKRIENSIVVVLQAGIPKGSAALIDDNGLFLVHKSAITVSTMMGRFANGETIQLTLVSSDDPTQLALLQADTWIRGRRQVLAVGNLSPVAEVNRAVPSKGSLVLPESNILAVLPTGLPMKAELSARDRIGIVNPARRVMTLCEYKFEAPANTVGGSLLFSLDGKLLGVLGATLGNQEASNYDLSARLGNTARGGGGIGGGGAAGITNFNAKAVGPAALTVGYSIGPDILQRVVDGFRSPTHAVEHPALGILCKDSSSGGALVETVLKDSPAEIGGLKAGDVITELDGQLVSSQIDYARIMLKQKVGATVKVKATRGTAEVLLTLKIGK